MSTLVAYHNDKKIKEKYVKRIQQHRKMEHLIQGKTWESNGTVKGCAIGCTLEAYDHSRYPVELGIPEMIAKLEDCIFEGLPVKEAMEWPERFLKAVPVGKDLARVCPKFLLSMLKRRKDALDANDLVLVGLAMDHAIKVIADWVEFGKVNQKSAESAAYAAASAWSAAASAWYAASAAAKSAEYIWMSDELIRLVKE